MDSIHFSSGSSSSSPPVANPWIKTFQFAADSLSRHVSQNIFTTETPSTENLILNYSQSVNLPVNQANNSSQPSGSAIAEFRSDSKTKYVWIITILVIFCVLVNCWTIILVFQSKRVKPVNYLIVNLSLVSIILSIYGLFYVGDFKLLKGPWFCGAFSYLRNTMVHVMGMTVLGISYERILSLKPRNSRVIISRVLFGIWIISALLSIPSFFQSIYVENDSPNPTCKKVPFMQIPAMGIAYEVFRFSVFHVAVCIYMLYELIKVRSKTKYLYLFKTIPNQKMRQKVQRVRFIYIFSIVFIFFWIPLGMCVSFLKAARRIAYIGKYSNALGVVMIVYYIFILISPIIILWTNEDISQRSLCSSRKPTASANDVTGDDGETIAAKSIQQCENVSGEGESNSKVSHSNKKTEVESELQLSSKKISCELLSKDENSGSLEETELKLFDCTTIEECERSVCKTSQNCCRKLEKV